MKIRNETGSENSSDRIDDQENKETVIATLDEASNADNVENYNDDGKNKNEEKQVENNPNTNDEEVLTEKTIVRLLSPYKTGRQAKLSNRKFQLSY